MKISRWKVPIWILVSILFWSAPVSFAETAATPAEEPSEYMVGDKLLRGFANVLTSPLEVPRCVQNTTEEQGVFVGWTAGMAMGIGMTALRILVGAYDIVTFPIPFPEGYRPVIKPEFVWQAEGPRLTPPEKAGA